MAEVLHMEPEEVLGCAVQLRAESDRIREQARALAVAARSVDWYGASRDYFQGEVEQLAIDFSQLADECEGIAIRVQQEIEQWRSIDAFFEEQYSQIIISGINKGKLV